MPTPSLKAVISAFAAPILYICDYFGVGGALKSADVKDKRSFKAMRALQPLETCLMIF